MKASFIQRGEAVDFIPSRNVDAGEISVLVNGQEALKHNGFGDTVSADLPGAAGTDMLTFDCDAGSISVKLTTK